jgi:hypothetical protein
MRPEIDDTDRTIIDQYISLLYAKAYNKQDMEKIRTTGDIWPLIGSVWENTIDQKIEEQLYQLRRQMRDRGIKVENTGKGVFDSMVRGYPHQIVLNANMAQLKAETVLQGIIDNLEPVEKQEYCPKCGGVVIEGKCVNGDYKSMDKE